MRTFGVTIAAVLAVLALAPAVSASGAVARAAGAAGADGVEAPAVGTAKPARTGRRCRSLARRRLAHKRRIAAKRGLARVPRRGRAEVERKLRRCLRAARHETPPPPTSGAPPIAPGPSETPVSPPPPGPQLPSFVGVTASDDDGFRLTLSRPAVAAGSVTIELRNSDSGPHDLVVEPEGGGGEAARFDPLEPGASPVRRTVSLPSGRWRLYCSLPNHALAGMEATLRAE